MGETIEDTFNRRCGIEVPLRMTNFRERTFRPRATKVLKRYPAEGPFTEDCCRVPRGNDFDAGGGGEDTTAPFADATEAGETPKSGIAEGDDEGWSVGG